MHTISTSSAQSFLCVHARLACTIEAGQRSAVPVPIHVHAIGSEYTDSLVTIRRRSLMTMLVVCIRNSDGEAAAVWQPGTARTK